MIEQEWSVEISTKAKNKSARKWREEKLPNVYHTLQNYNAKTTCKKTHN